MYIWSACWATQRAKASQCIETHEAHWLPIRTIAELWAKETGEPSPLMESSLIQWFMGLLAELGEDAYSGVGLTTEIENKLTRYDDWEVDRDRHIHRKHLALYCENQKVTKPEFWFGRTEEGPNFPGKPSIMKAIRQELRRRAQAQDLEPTLAEQAREMVRWADQEFPTVQTPKAKSMENGIRKLYWELRGAPQN